MESILEHFPTTSWAFAYGSGVFEQLGYAGSFSTCWLCPCRGTRVTRLSFTDEVAAPAPMLDVIFVVDDPQEWHAQNVALHPEHYSAAARLGAPALALIQALPAGLYFNTGMPLPGAPPPAPGNPVQQLKYGVVSTQALLQDLLQWRSLYVAGRLHKPVRFLKPPPAHLVAPFQANIASAMAASLLLLPGRFPLHSWLHCMCGLSYRGDFRMAVGENPHKVTNIAAANTQHFMKLYLASARQHALLHTLGVGPHSLALPPGHVATSSLAAATQVAAREVAVDHGAAATAAAVALLPAAFRRHVLLGAGVTHAQLSPLERRGPSLPAPACRPPCVGTSHALLRLLLPCRV
jgi:translocator assembly and maintenance protein 41